VFATVARHVELFEAWSPFAHKLLLDSSFAARPREIVILRVARRSGCAYEWGHHARIGLRSGLTEAEVESLATGEPWLADACERDLVLAVDELSDQDRISGDTWTRLTYALSEEQLVEPPFLVGGYRMLAGALNTLGVAPECPLPALGEATSSVPEGGRVP
jgi:alkylhydroperoxidase family enzyme